MKKAPKLQASVFKSLFRIWLKTSSLVGPSSRLRILMSRPRKRLKMRWSRNNKQLLTLPASRDKEAIMTIITMIEAVDVVAVAAEMIVTATIDATIEEMARRPTWRSKVLLCLLPPTVEVVAETTDVIKRVLKEIRIRASNSKNLRLSPSNWAMTSLRLGSKFFSTSLSKIKPLLKRRRRMSSPCNYLRISYQTDTSPKRVVMKRRSVPMISSRLS